MIEAEWQSATNVHTLLQFLRDRPGDYVKPTERKRRLFRCACGRRCLRYLPTEWHLKTIEEAERFADGLVSWKRLAEAETKAHYAPTAPGYVHNVVVAETVRSMVAQLVGDHDDVWDSMFGTADYACEAVGGCPSKPSDEEQRAQCDIARDIFGNPFRLVAFAPEWRTDTALVLARQMYEAREFSAAPILADALQDAGCDSDDILNHLRDTTATHVRGCWALDLVLGRE